MTDINKESEPHQPSTHELMQDLQQQWWDGKIGRSERDRLMAEIACPPDEPF